MLTEFTLSYRFLIKSMVVCFPIPWEPSNTSSTSKWQVTFKDHVRNGRDAFPMVPLFADVAFCTPQRWRFPGRFIPRHSAVTDHRDVLEKYLFLRALFLHLRDGKRLKEGDLNFGCHLGTREKLKVRFWWVHLENFDTPHIKGRIE